MIRVNMDKAREIKKAQIREARKPLLEALDVAFMRAVEVGDNEEQVRVSSEKQVLRDATNDPAIAAASTPEELVAVNPLGV